MATSLASSCWAFLLYLPPQHHHMCHLKKLGLHETAWPQGTTRAGGRSQALSWDFGKSELHPWALLNPARRQWDGIEDPRTNKERQNLITKICKQAKLVLIKSLACLHQVLMFHLLSLLAQCIHSLPGITLLLVCWLMSHRVLQSPSLLPSPGCPITQHNSFTAGLTL